MKKTAEAVFFRIIDPRRIAHGWARRIAQRDQSE